MALKKAAEEVLFKTDFEKHLNFSVIKRKGVSVGFKISNKPSATEEIKRFCFNFSQLMFNENVKFILNRRESGGFVVFYDKRQMGNSIIKFEIKQADMDSFESFWKRSAEDGLFERRISSKNGVVSLEVKIPSHRESNKSLVKNAA